MRFIHVADIHLGAEPDKGREWSKNRGKEIWETFERLIDRVGEQKADMLLIAGDLFHRQPLLRELKEVNYLFSKIPDTKVVIIAGNHDYLHRDSYYRTFSWNENVYFIMSGEPCRIFFEDLNTEIYGFSYYEKEIDMPVYDDVVPADKSHINILLAHGGDENHVPIHGRRVLLNGFDYIALGHIHKPELLTDVNDVNGSCSRARYAGSLEPLDITETGEHGYILGEVDKKGCKTVFVPFASRKYIQIDIPVTPDSTFFEIKGRVLGEITVQGENNIYSIILTGLRDEIVEIAPEQLEKLGNIAKIEDRTIPDYHYEEMIRENGDNLLSRYLKFFLEDGRRLSEVEKKALDYGVRALVSGE